MGEEIRCKGRERKNVNLREIFLFNCIFCVFFYADAVTTAAGVEVATFSVTLVFSSSSTAAVSVVEATATSSCSTSVITTAGACSSFLSAEAAAFFLLFFLNNSVKRPRGEEGRL